MRLLVLGGSAFVGHAVVDAALARGWSVTAFNRGRGGAPPAGVEHLTGDRMRSGGVDVLRGRRFDAVIDTWQGSARAVREAVRLLAGAVGYYGYVSSVSVYASPPPRPLGETADLEPPPKHGRPTYQASKAEADRAVAEEFSERALLARAGLILGPHENVGRLPRWLLRMRDGGDVLAPGRPGRQVQFVDARDLAAWMLDCAERGLGGAYNVVCPPGRATMADVLGACRRVTASAAKLHWVEDEWLLRAGVEPWTELPLWLPERGDDTVLYNVDAARAVATGATFRSPDSTVADTWAWLSAVPFESLASAAGQRKRWLTRAKEKRLLSESGSGGARR